jgi:uncharacterized protein
MSSIATSTTARPFRIDIASSESVTAMAYPAADGGSSACLILGHGAGADQSSSFMVRFASALALRGIGTITFNFLYTEQGRRLPDRNDKLEACYRKGIEAVRGGAAGDIGHGALVIGGKSMGGRIATQVAAAGGVDVAGLVLLGYPLHPPGRPDQLRSRHLAAITAPMLFVQGSRDTFGTPEELAPIIRQLQVPADLFVVDGGDHSFKVLKRSGQSQDKVYETVLDAIAAWIRRLLFSPA